MGPVAFELRKVHGTQTFLVRADLARMLRKVADSKTPQILAMLLSLEVSALTMFGPPGAPRYLVFSLTFGEPFEAFAKALSVVVDFGDATSSEISRLRRETQKADMEKAND